MQLVLSRWRCGLGEWVRRREKKESVGKMRVKERAWMDIGKDEENGEKKLRTGMKKKKMERGDDRKRVSKDE